MSTSTTSATEIRHYEDFELTTVPVGVPHTCRVIARSSAGQASSQTTLDPTTGAWRTALEAIEREKTSEEFFLGLGQRLFEALLPDDVQALYRASLGHAKGEGKGLRLRLRLTEAPELAALPWEYLYDPQRDIFLGISSDTPLSRFIEPAQSFPPPPPLDEKLRLLTIISQPQDLARIDSDAVFNTMDQALRRLKSQNQLEEIPPLHHAVRADIAEALREHRPHVLHMVSHGAFDAQKRRGKLFLEDPNHLAFEMSDRAFRELLEGHSDIRLVVLDVSQGATRDAGDAMIGIGPQLVSRGVPAVVAKQYHIDEVAAVNLTREFYQALTHWYPIDVALAQARRAIYLDYGPDRRDWGVPVLFMRDRDGMLFQPPAPEPEERKAEPAEAASGGPVYHVHIDRVEGLAIGDGAQIIRGDQSPSAGPPKPPEAPPDPARLAQIRAAYVQSSHKYYLEYRSKLHRLLDEFFDAPNLRQLCFEMGIDFDNLRGETKSAKAMELVLYAERHSRAYELVDVAYRWRPNADW